MIVNGVDLTSLGFIPRTRTLPRVGGERTTAVAIPGAAGVRMGGIFEPARLSVDGTIKAASHAALLENLDGLAAALRGECAVRFSDISDREWTGYLQQGSSASLFDPQWIQSGGRVSLEFVCPDPRSRALADTERSGSGALVLGSAPSAMRVEFTGAAATIRVRAGGSLGTVLTELVWSGASGALVVDAETFEVSVAGVNAIDGLTAASVFPIADPAAGADYIEVPAGAAVSYRRRWL